MLKRTPLVIAAVAATVAVATLSTQAYADDDALLGAVVGAGIGATIGHNVHGRDGAVVGGAIGALAGASIAASSDRYYNTGYYAAPYVAYQPAPVYAPVYYGAPSTYYEPAPVYYRRPPIVYAPRVDYVRYYGSRYVEHGRPSDHGRNDWHDDNGHRGH